MFNFISVCSSNVYADAISKLPAICNAFLEQDNLESLCCSKYNTSVFAIKNKRRKMEDRHVILHDLNAVLDLKVGKSLILCKTFHKQYSSFIIIMKECSNYKLK